MEIKIIRRGFASSILLCMFGVLWYFLRAWAAGGLGNVVELGEAVIDFLEKRSRDGAAVCHNHVETGIGSETGSDSRLDGEVDDNAAGIDMGFEHPVHEAEEIAQKVASRMVIWVAERIVQCKKIALYPWGESRRGNVLTYYAVAEGWHRGVYGTWPECREAVVQYPTARFMAFGTREGAEKFIVGWSHHFVPKGGFKSIP